MSACPSACLWRIPYHFPRGRSPHATTPVKVRGDDGVEGLGFCYGGSTGGRIVTAALRELLAPVVMGQDPYLVEGPDGIRYGDPLLHSGGQRFEPPRLHSKNRFI
jgi:L-alanine-DL-glutamate epimerase-like enolase superfamily enzyme